MSRLHELTGLVDEEFHPVEFAQQVGRKLDVGLVDLIDQEHGLDVAEKRLPDAAAHDVVAYVLDAVITEL